MKKTLILLSSIFMLVVLSSFGVAENNKYVRAKTYQVEKAQKTNTLVNLPQLSERQVVSIGEDDSSESIAASLGTFLLDSLKAFVQNLLSMLKN